MSLGTLGDQENTGVAYLGLVAWVQAGAGHKVMLPAHSSLSEHRWYNTALCRSAYLVITNFRVAKNTGVTCVFDEV